ncbi:MAG: AI-2E family transporter [Muribaculaceae bacterium]|nr:AI-2E family transporter [Muribaculaceae bacterium]
MKILFSALAVLVLIWLINILKDVLLPFCVACLVAYILEPLVEVNRTLLHCKRRGIPVFVTLFEVTLVLAIMTYFFVPSVVREIDQMRMIMQANSDHHVYMPYLPAEIHAYLDRYFTMDYLIKLLNEGHFTTLVDKGTNMISGTVEVVLHTIEWLLTFIYIVFVMLDYEHIMKGFRMMVPPKFRNVAYKIGDDIKVNMNHYFRGQALIAGCAAVFYCIGFSIVGIPLAIVLGLLVGILYMIPYFQYVTLIPVAIVCYITSLAGASSFASLLGQCLLVYFFSQMICDYILTPKILGKAMGLNPAIILLSLSVWGTLLGLIGMIIALPLTTILLAYYQEYVIERVPLIKKNTPPSNQTPAV